MLKKHYQQARCQSVPLSVPILQQKARRLAEMLGHDELVCSNGLGWVGYNDSEADLDIVLPNNGLLLMERHAV